MERLFTRQEAEDTLPHIAPLLWELKRLNETVANSARQLAAVQSATAGNGHGLDGDMAHARQEQAQATAQMQRLLDQVAEMGVEIKDLSEGLIDFRSEMDGRVVYLCWKLGEEHVDWWHELDTGFAGRQPLA
jgi:hypothetical protein